MSNLDGQKLWTDGLRKPVVKVGAPPQIFIASEPIPFYIESVPIKLTLTYWTFLEFQSNLTVFANLLNYSNFVNWNFQSLQVHF